MKASTRENLLGYAFVLPWLIALLIFVSYPFLSTLYFSLCDFGPMKAPLLVGTENYQELLGDSLFHRSLSVTFVYASVAIPLGVLMAMTLAMLLNARIRGQSIYRVLFYLPHLVPTVVVAILWMWMFNPQFGILNVVLKAVLGALDRWTELFFDLSAAVGGERFARPAAALLLLPAVLAAAWRLRLLPRRWRERPVWRHVLAATIVAAVVLAALPALNALLHRLAPADMTKLRNPAWLTDPNPFPSAVRFAPSWALWALIIMSLWSVGQMAIIYLAKLQDVPEDLYEAADIDGANWWSKTRHITIPMISPVILFNVVLAIIGTFQIFAEPYIMTQGGPENRTRFLAVFIYNQAFEYQRVGYASAVAWVLFLIIVALTFVAFGVARKRVYYAGR